MSDEQIIRTEDVLALFTVADAEAVLGRPLLPGEASSIRKTLGFALPEPFADAIQAHAEWGSIDPETVKALEESAALDARAETMAREGDA